MKVALILVDGMRSDSIINIKKAQEMISKSSYTMEAKTVMPSVTLPCHISLFHSVEPSRHGTTTNFYAPQVRPVAGLIDVLNSNKKSSAAFYNWEPLRDIARPNSLTYSYFCRTGKMGPEKADDVITDISLAHINNSDLDFTFIYLGYPDNAGHKFGWMSDEYMHSIEHSWDCIEKICNSLGDDYTVIVTADHGGHDRIHGMDLPEDMIIPVIIKGKDFKAEKIQKDVSILDIAPTIAKLIGVKPDEEWEGKSLI